MGWHPIQEGVHVAILLDVVASYYMETEINCSWVGYLVLVQTQPTCFFYLLAVMLQVEIEFRFSGFQRELICNFLCLS